MNEKIDFPGKSTLRVRWVETPFFNYPWHYHSEYEILYLLESTGTRFVGDHLESFEKGDMVMIAGNLPHFWRNDEAYYSGKAELNANRIVIQFPLDFLKPQIDTYPEFMSIKNLLLRSEQGIRFLPPDNYEIGEMLMELPSLSGFEQIIRFLEILYHMAATNNYKLLASDIYMLEKHVPFDNRLDKVIHYLNVNYQKPITLDKIAGIAGMHPTAFCRYFKDKTGKPLSVYLTELRVGFACKLLMEGSMQVSQICYESGFNNLSNFNRTFRRITGLTPTSYKEQFLASV